MMWVYGLVAFCAVLGAVGQIFFKLGVSPFSVSRLFAGALFYGVSLVMYLYALRFAPVSVVYPIIACSYIIVAVLAWWLLGEQLTVRSLAGSAVIVFGVWLVVG